MRHPSIIPQARFVTRIRDDSSNEANPYVWRNVSSTLIFANKTVVLFALPGAFTPTCSSTHLPRFEQIYDELCAHGVDEIYCLSVNDAFVMHQWARQQGIEKVNMLPDGNGEFSRKMNMLIQKDNLGFGQRSWRYSMLVRDRSIERMFIERGKAHNSESDPLEVSDADTMLAHLRGTVVPPKPDPLEFIG